MNSRGPGLGLFASLRVLLDSGFGLARNRLALLSVELEEEKARILSLLAYGAAALILLSAGSVFLAMFVTVLFWDSYRLLALGLFAAIFLTAGGVALVAAKRQGDAGSRLFSASLAELDKDRAALGGDAAQRR